MSKTYLVSEEFLRQLLDDALKDDLYEVVNSLRTLLAKEPNEPVVRNSFQEEEYMVAQRNQFNRDHAGNG
jgi:hypothetical protein